MTHEFEFHQLPEEIREAMERHQQLHQMQADDYRHSVQRFFDELDKDQLVTFRWMLRNMGMGGSQLPDLKAEFNTTEHFTRGVVAAARSANPDSANSQFFIMFGDAPWLDGQYTIWGKVVSGMEAVDKIKKGQGDQPVVDPDKIISATIKYE